MYEPTLRLVFLTVLVAIFLFPCAAHGQLAATGPTEISQEIFPAPAPYLQKYSQTLAITFRDAEAARLAGLDILPLYDGKEWAITSRWDDNQRRDIQMREVLDKHGYKGTFYLTGTEMYLETFPGVDRQLVPSEHSIGGHSWTHPMLTHLSRNRIFEEVMRIRAVRESSADTLINSYAFSYCNFYNGVEGIAISRSIAEALFRAGYYHVANSRFNRDAKLDIPTSYLLPEDGRKPIDDTFARFLADEKIKQENPNITFNMHVWYKTDEAWANFEAELDRYGRNPDWWYCNQNQYAAYRWQYKNTDITTAIEGNQLRVTLNRPTLRDLNDPTPLTLAINGVAADMITSIKSENSLIERVDKDGQVRFHLHHPADQQLPTTVGWIANDDNHQTLTDEDVDSDFPKLTALLWTNNDTLYWTLQNRSDTPITNLHATIRLPLACNPPVVFNAVGDLAPGETRIQSLPMQIANSDFKYQFGARFSAVQIDFTHNGKVSRLHLTNRERMIGHDRSYPYQGFARLGPIPHEQYTQAIVEAIVRGETDGVSLADGSTLDFGFSASRNDKFDVEIIETSGKWVFRSWDMTGDGVYLLRGVIRSPKKQSAQVQTHKKSIGAIYLNGKITDGQSLVLNAGDNPIIIVAPMQNTRVLPDNAGIFFRLTSSDTGGRLTNIKFVEPDMKNSQ